MAVSKIKLQRIIRGLSQSRLTIVTGIPQWRISLIERGVVPTCEEAARIAAALGCRPEDVFLAHQLVSDDELKAGGSAQNERH